VQFDPKEWPELSRLLDCVLDLPVAEREDWVRGLTGPDAALAPRLLALLETATDAKTVAWFDTLPKFSRLSDPALVTLMRSDVVLEQEGDEVGPYRLVRLLGRGGMGSVWYAERSDRLVRRGVALKLPLAMSQSRHLAARFDREREIVSSLVHPHIARLYDAGVSSAGQAYLALEYVEGKPLNEYCDLHRLDVHARVRLFGQVLGAVQYAHSRLVIHRDIKPSNILVTADGWVRLLDFGVAKLLGSEEADSAELTRLGAPAITLAYASPEQVAGRPVTTATDIYSLGVVLYELLVGVRPYRPKRDTRGALEEAILHADISPPSAVSISEPAAAARSSTLRKLRRELRGDLDAILLKALHREPQQRYATVAGFAEDLGRYRDGNPVQAHRPSRWYRFQKFVGRNRFAVGAAAAASLALFTASGIAFWQAQEAGRQAQIAATERDRALTAADHREAVDEFLSDLLLEAGRTGKPISIATLISRADELSAREFADNPEDRAAVLNTVGSFELEFGGIEKALSDFDQAQQMLANSRDTGLRASVACSRALLRGVLGHVAESERMLREIVDDPQTPRYYASECLGDLAQLALRRLDGPAAAEAAAQALAQWEASTQRSPFARLQLLTFQAQAQALNGQPGRADASYAQIMSELQRLGRDRGNWANYVRSNRVDAAVSSGDLHLALSLIDEAIGTRAQDVPDRPPPALSLYARSGVAADLGRYSEALAGFEKAAALAASQDRTIEQRALLDAAVVLSKLGRPEEAEQHYRRGVDIAGPELAGQGPSGDIARLLTRAKLDLDRHYFHSARENLSQALQLAGGGAAMVAASIQRYRALADLGDGDVDEALRDARVALESSKALRGDKTFSVWVGQTELALGQALQARGDVSGARQAYAAAMEQLSHSVEAAHPALQQARTLLSDASRATP
jgi:serine/threonine-protein kinase